MCCFRLAPGMPPSLVRFEITNIAKNVSYDELLEALTKQLALDDVDLITDSLKPDGNATGGDTQAAELAIPDDEADLLRGPMQEAKVFVESLGITTIIRFREVSGKETAAPRGCRDGDRSSSTDAPGVDCRARPSATCPGALAPPPAARRPAPSAASHDEQKSWNAGAYERRFPRCSEDPDAKDHEREASRGSLTSSASGVPERGGPRDALGAARPPEAGPPLRSLLAGGGAPALPGPRPPCEGAALLRPSLGQSAWSTDPHEHHPRGYRFDPDAKDCQLQVDRGSLLSSASSLQERSGAHGATGTPEQRAAPAPLRPLRASRETPREAASQSVPEEKIFEQSAPDMAYCTRFLTEPNGEPKALRACAAPCVLQ